MTIVSEVNKIYTLNEIKSISTPIFKKYASIKEVYLFGSYARNEATERSDIDFMLVLNDYDIKSRKDGLIVEADLYDGFQKNVDTINYEQAMRVMKESIERDGIKIYEQEI